jgi:hypothetical protein
VGAILEKSGISADLPEYKPFHNKRHTEYKYSPGLYETAHNIYRQLGDK